jgi:nitrate reductase NapE component
MIAQLGTRGITGPSGAQYVQISHGTCTVCLPLARIVLDERGARKALLDQGIPVVSAAVWRRLIDKVECVREFPIEPLVEKVGWNGKTFALPDGTIFPVGQETPAAIEVHKRKCAQRGKFKHWYSRVAAPLERQHLATFLMMAAFAPPILSLADRVGNFGFEIVGPKGTGKSTLQYLVSSALGGVGQGPGGHYWVTLDTTYNALEDTMKLHSDLPIIMDEANLLAAGATRRERADLFQALAFKLGSGSIKDRYRALAENDYRLVFIISSNEPLATLLGQSTESARAAADRLITLPITITRPYGVFDHLPEGYASGSEFARDLMRHAERHHGHAMRRFLAKLVEECIAGKAGLKRKIRKHVAKFRQEAGVDANSGSAVRVADAFGLVFAAGELALEYGVLPPQLRTGAAALECYRSHVAHANGSSGSFGDKLLSLASDDRIRTLKKDGRTIPDALGYLSKGKSQTELLIPPANIEALIPGWRALRGSRDVNRYLVRDGSHRTVKRWLGGEKRERVHCFLLPQTDVSESE